MVEDFILGRKESLRKYENYYVLHTFPDVRRNFSRGKISCLFFFHPLEFHWKLDIKSQFVRLHFIFITTFSHGECALKSEIAISTLAVVTVN